MSTKPRSGLSMQSGAAKPFVKKGIVGVREAFENADYYENLNVRQKFFSSAYDNLDLAQSYLHFYDQKNGKKSIGLRGRMQAVCALLALAGNEISRSESLAAEICAPHVVNWDDASVENAQKTVSVLLNVATPTKLVGFSCHIETATSECALTWAVAYVADQLAVLLTSEDRAQESSEIVKTIQECLTTSEHIRIPYEQPVELFNAMAVALGFSEDEATAAKAMKRHYIDKGFERYAVRDRVRDQHRAKDVEGAVVAILGALEHKKIVGPDRCRLAILYGDANTGKKSVVGDILIRLRDTAEDVGYLSYGLEILDDRQIVTQLPVFAINVQSVRYAELVALVYGFLLRLSKPEETRSIEEIAELVSPDNRVRGSLADLLEQIHTLHDQNDAFFIFSDVNGLGRDAVQRVISGREVYGLLSTLLDSNSDSRFVVTQAKGSLDSWVKKTPNDSRLFPMNPPNFDRFYWYPSDTQLRYFQNEIEPHILPLTGYDTVETTGDMLLTLTAFVAVEPDPKCTIDVFNTILRNAYEGERQEKDLSKTLIDSLLKAFEKVGILPAISLIAAAAATEDALMMTSLAELISQWHRHYSLVDDPKTPEPDISSISDRLDALGHGTQALYLTRRSTGDIDRSEFGLGEDLTSGGHEEWFMSASIADALLQGLQKRKDGPKVARRAFRLIATAARRRAQMKRMFFDELSFEPRPGVARDIQSYHALLASLPENIKRTAEPASAFGNLRMLTGDTFSFDIDAAPEQSLRFALRLLLQQDIDQSNRLSMVTDQDELRLKLFLRAFMPLGSFPKFTLNDVRGVEVTAALPSQMPPHLVAALNPYEQLELLVSTCLAAFHSQLEGVVAWAGDLAQAVFDMHNLSQCSKASGMLNRIQCTRIDAAIGQASAEIPARRSPNDSGDLNAVLCLVDSAWVSWKARVEVHRNGPEIVEFFDRIVSGQVSPAESVELNPSKAKAADLFSLDHFDTSEVRMLVLLREMPHSEISQAMRLLARRAEVLWMLAPLGISPQMHAHSESEITPPHLAIFDALQALEHVVSKISGRDIDAPVTFSGKSGRQMIRVLTNDEIVLHCPKEIAEAQHLGGDERKSSKELDLRILKVRQILQANIARLEKYSGAERLHTIAGHALWHYAARQDGSTSHETQLALNYISRACDQLNAHQISHAGRLDLLIYEIGLKLLVSGGDEKGETFETIEECKRLLLVSEDLFLLPTTVRLNILLGRAYMTRVALQKQSKVSAERTGAIKAFGEAKALAKKIKFRPAEECADAWLRRAKLRT